MLQPAWLSNIADFYGSAFRVLWQDEELVLCRGRTDERSRSGTILIKAAATDRPDPATLARLAHYYGLRDCLGDEWAARPIDLVQRKNRSLLILKDPGGEPLTGWIGRPMETRQFLRSGIAIAGA